jgi:hypothetical protein
MSEHYPYIRPESPPTSYAIASFLDGEPGGGWRVISGAATRALFLAPGLWLGLKLADVKVTGKQVATASLVGSATITAMLVLYYSFRKAGGPALPSR